MKRNYLMIARDYMAARVHGYGHALSRAVAIGNDDVRHGRVYTADEMDEMLYRNKEDDGA